MFCIFAQLKFNLDKMKRIVLFLTLLLTTTMLVAQNVTMESYTFAHKDGRELCLDIYSAEESVEEVQPCLLYVFGGAFLAGSRAEPAVKEVYEYFAQRGWKVVAIDYRLGLLPLIKEPDAKRSLFDFRAMLLAAIDMATEDLLDATAYLVANAEELKINPNQIVTLGSSAGAIASCQAEWAIANELPEAAVLPADFNYAGVISMAGAICSPSRKLSWKREPCPIMLFHGKSDQNVPYDRLSLFGGVSLIGSELIAESLAENGYAYWFYDANNVDHGLSWWPMFTLRPEIELFAERMVFGEQKLQIHQRANDLSLPEREHKFGLMDYIKANFAPNKPRQAEAATN